MSSVTFTSPVGGNGGINPGINAGGDPLKFITTFSFVYSAALRDLRCNAERNKINEWLGSDMIGCNITERDIYREMSRLLGTRSVHADEGAIKAMRKKGFLKEFKDMCGKWNNSPSSSNGKAKTGIVFVSENWPKFFKDRKICVLVENDGQNIYFLKDNIELYMKIITPAGRFQMMIKHPTDFNLSAATITENLNNAAKKEEITAHVDKCGECTRRKAVLKAAKEIMEGIDNSKALELLKPLISEDRKAVLDILENKQSSHGRMVADQLKILLEQQSKGQPAK
jgi:hypothetical protein